MKAMSIKAHLFRGLGIATGIVWVLGAMSSSFSQQTIGVLSLIGFVLSLLSWGASIYVWAKIPERTILNYVALPILVLFGFLTGWVYLLFRSEVVANERHTQLGVSDVPEVQ